MKTQTKNREQVPCDFVTEKHKLRSCRVEPCTIFSLLKNSEPGSLYSIIGRPTGFGTTKIMVTDGTAFMEIVYFLRNQNQWLHSLGEGYHQFILHCRKKIDADENQYYIEKINHLSDLNYVPFHMIKSMMNNRWQK